MDPKKVAMNATGSTIIKLFNNGLLSDDQTAGKGSRVGDEEGTRTGRHVYRYVALQSIYYHGIYRNQPYNYKDDDYQLMKLRPLQQD
jgi:hypothetical protein